MKPNILLVLPFPPYPCSSGGHVAIFNAVLALGNYAKLIITYQCADTEQNRETAKTFEETVGEEAKVLPMFQMPSKPNRILDFIYKMKFRIKTVLGGKAVVKKSGLADRIEQMFRCDEQFVNHCNELIAKYDIDIVQCEMLETASLVLAFPPQVKKVFVEHEIGFVRNLLEIQTLASGKISNSIIAELLKELEVSLLNRFDVVVTLSETDTAKLKDAGVKSKIVSSNVAVIVPNTTDKTVDEPYNHCLSFVGPEMHPCNKDGVLWFLDECWNRILEKEPDCRLRIIGNWTEETRYLLNGKYKNLDFLGFVEDLSSVLRGTTMIVPIRIGSGIRIKILEACSYGIPFVSTTVGAEGIPLESGKHCFISDDAEGFSEYVLKLADDGIRAEFSKAEKCLMSQEFSFESLQKTRALAISEALSC